MVFFWDTLYKRGKTRLAGYPGLQKQDIDPREGAERRATKLVAQPWKAIQRTDHKELKLYPLEVRRIILKVMFVCLFVLPDSP